MVPELVCTPSIWVRAKPQSHSSVLKRALRCTARHGHAVFVKETNVLEEARKKSGRGPSQGGGVVKARGKSGSGRWLRYLPEGWLPVHASDRGPRKARFLCTKSRYIIYKNGLFAGLCRRRGPVATLRVGNAANDRFRTFPGPAVTLAQGMSGSGRRRRGPSQTACRPLPREAALYPLRHPAFIAPQ